MGNQFVGGAMLAPTKPFFNTENSGTVARVVNSAVSNIPKALGAEATGQATSYMDNLADKTGVGGHYVGPVTATIMSILTGGTPLTSRRAFGGGSQAEEKFNSLAQGGQPATANTVGGNISSLEGNIENQWGGQSVVKDIANQSSKASQNTIKGVSGAVPTNQQVGEQIPAGIAAYKKTIDTQGKPLKANLMQVMKDQNGDPIQVGTKNMDAYFDKLTENNDKSTLNALFTDPEFKKAYDKHLADTAPIPPQEVSTGIANPDGGDFTKTTPGNPRGTYPIDVLLDTKQKLGAKVYEQRNGDQANAISGALKGLQGAMAQDIEEAAQHKGANAADALSKYNSFYKQHFDIMERYLQPLIDAPTPENVARLVTAKTDKGGSMLTTLKDILPKQTFGTVKSLITGTLGQSSSKADGEGPSFTGQQYLNDWNGLNGLSPEAKKALYSPSELADLDRLAKNIQLLKDANPAYVNGETSSDHSNFHQTRIIGYSAIGTATGLTTGHTTAGMTALGIGALTAVGPAVVSRLMANPTFVKFLAQSNKVSESTAAAYASNMNNAWSKSNHSDEDNKAFNSFLSAYKSILGK
jgi:hypothetical protein